MTVLPEPRDVERFRALVAERYGLRYENGKLDYLADILSQRVHATGSPTPEAYLARFLLSPSVPSELRLLAEQLTVNETFFFRNMDNFRAFAERVLPERARQRAGDRRLRILSAGCASGDEAYSLAIAVREGLSNLDAWDVEIVGVDVSPAMLAKAATGRYSAWALRATSEDVKGRYFRAEGRDFLLDSAVRALVSFKEQNLLQNDLVLFAPRTYDVIFCRNVLMYFTPESMLQVVERLERSLVPGGFLFLGHAETLRGLSQDFHLCHTHDTFYYQKREGAASASELRERTTASLGEPVALPNVVDDAASWLEAIQRASERIHELEQKRSLGSHAPPGAAPSPPKVRSFDLGLVLEAMRTERFSDALTLLSELPADSKSEPDALLLHAVLLTNSGRLEEAEEACARLLSLDELNAGAHYLMALCREHAGDKERAIEHDRTALYLDRDFAMPHLHMGLLARRSGDAPTARAELSRALTLLAREDASRVLLFGGGFSREMLLGLCRTELRALGDGA